ncbi:uncharacterized protein LOC122509966 isoform X1 [Leptopilina heterotoma]|uniref:uncharacterized protein LOC122509966 isoform X1 n=1 Tax=Leptopilina heterotoma TaxID=63436 RepID=UPI001CA82BE9|nr:uncharacterized protein LOC122509966 isoform X1 [Leptopilina heterotoma]
MDNKVVSEIEDNSMIESSEISELFGASPRLSPLTSSLDQNLTLHEDNLLSVDNIMGIENTWAESNTPASDFPIPLPAPGDLEGYADPDVDPIDTNGGIEYGPFLPSNTRALNNLFTDTGETQENSENETTLAGVCGLRNLGNTCFMAAGLQCLTATPPVLRHFIDLQQQGEKLPPPGSLMAHFSSLLSQMWSGRHSVIRPTEFKQSLGAYHSQFKDYRQHDCQEFLALLLDSLHEQMNVAKPAKNCQSSMTINTANSVITNQNGKQDSVDATFTATNNTEEEFMDCYDNSPSPECPNSPNVTMAGSPRDLSSPVGDLDSTTNTPHGSPLNEDEETLDSDEVTVTKPRFIHNKTQKDDLGSVNFNSHYSKLDKLNDLHGVNNYPGLCDILKEAKTSNANFLVTQPECNNEIHYDSQKFPKENIRRTTLDNSNLTENHDFDNKNVSVKRINEVNVQKNNCSVECVGISSGSEPECDSGLEKCNVKRMRLEDQEKNHRRDGLGPSGMQSSKNLQNYENGAVASQDEIEADKHWAKHLKANRSVIVDTFQGQFKSTVVCAVCKHVSVTYEPFMYLSVPLPHAMERQLSVTYVPANNESPVRCVVSLNKQSRIGKLKEELLKLLGKEHVAMSNIALAEVLENHIARILEDNTMLKYVNAMNRSIYAFELTDPPDGHSTSTSIPDGGGDRVIDSEFCQNGTTSNEEVGTCLICLEECDGELKKHSENNCNFIMCDPCVENYFKSQATNNCPVCSTSVTAASFTKIDQTGRPRPAIRILNVPLVLRYDTNEATNNRRDMKLFSYPHLVRLPSRVNAADLYEVVRRVVPQEGKYTIHFVDGQGHHCSRCIYTKHCTGCGVPETGTVSLQNGDTLAVRYTENIPKFASPIDHISVTKQRPPHPLSLYDCLQAFSQSETLDEHNPWFCPKCEVNQCATKSLTVHRYPKFLIVYLKRFVFHECISMKLDDKVTFPLVGLSVGKHLYDLYACVCHFGGVSAGHYTAYARNPRTDLWHYYNDEETSKKKPHDEDFSNAYILFYNRQQGTNLKPCNI